MEKSISKIFYIGIITTLIVIIFFAPTTGGPCNAGLDLIFVVFALLISGLLGIISIRLIKKGNNKNKEIIFFLSGCSLAFWSFLLFELAGENLILSLYMVPLMIIYLLIMLTGIKINKPS
jgi:hypothetical protein